MWSTTAWKTPITFCPQGTVGLAGQGDTARLGGWGAGRAGQGPAPWTARRSAGLAKTLSYFPLGIQRSCTGMGGNEPALLRLQLHLAGEAAEEDRAPHATMAPQTGRTGHMWRGKGLPRAQKGAERRGPGEADGQRATGKGPIPGGLAKWEGERGWTGASIQC